MSLLLLHFPFFAPLHGVSVAARSSGADTLRTLHETCATFDLLCRRVGRTVYTGYRDIYLLSHWYANVSSGQGADGRERVSGKEEKENRFVGWFWVGVTFHCRVEGSSNFGFVGSFLFFFFFLNRLLLFFSFSARRLSKFIEIFLNRFENHLQGAISI